MKWLAAIAAALMLWACTQPGGNTASMMYFADIDGSAWQYSQPVTFDVDSTADSISSGALLLSLRHTANYRYRNIWVEVMQEANSTPALRDTFEVTLADPFGQWYGAGMGASLRFTDTLSQRYIIRRGARLSLRHIMRIDTLAGIEQVGLILTQQ